MLSVTVRYHFCEAGKPATIADASMAAAWLQTQLNGTRRLAD